MHLIPTRCATTAIAAALALGSTGLLAQAAIPDSGPVVAPPPVVSPPPTQAAPVPPPAQQTIIVPTEDLVPGPAPQASVSPPVIITPVEAEEPAAATPRAATRTARAAPAPTMAAQPEPAAETAADETTEPFAPEVETVFVPPVALDADAAEAEAAAANRPDLLDLAGYAVATLLFIALIAFIFRRSRKPKRFAAKTEQKRPIEPRREPQPAAPPVAPTTIETPAMPVIASGAFAQHQPTPMATYRREPALRPSGQVVLPRRVPEDFAERDALLKRMIAAKPDRANPFHSTKARAHRARLILQSIGQNFRDRDPWIDLSGYPDIWPEVAHRKFPHAA